MMETLTYLGERSRRPRPGRAVGLLGSLAAIAGVAILLANWDQVGSGLDDLALGAVLTIGGLLLRIEGAIVRARSQTPGRMEP